jgi:predicted acyltransferase (DUF342 family)
METDYSQAMFSHVIIFDYEKVVLDFGLEATANLLNAFNVAFLENIKEQLENKCLNEIYSSITDGNIKIISYDKTFHNIIKNLVDALNENSKEIISQIKHDDLLLEDEQKEFFKKIISYELLHILLKMETERVRGSNGSDKKSSKI